MIQPNELHTPNLTPVARAALVTAANAVEMGLAEVTVAMTYRKQTKTRPRVAGEDYVAMPGVSCEAQAGTLMVERFVDNPANRKAQRAGKVYFKIRSTTRADGSEPIGFTNIRPEGITAFAVLGTRPLPRKQEG
jgi:hypothetical protein